MAAEGDIKLKRKAQQEARPGNASIGDPRHWWGLGRGGAESRGTWVESACRAPLPPPSPPTPLHFAGPGNSLYLHPPALKEKEVGLQSGEMKTEGYLFRQPESPKHRGIERESAKRIESP